MNLLEENQEWNLGELVWNDPYHLLADDIQLHFSFKPSEAFRLSRLPDCLKAIRGWTTDNFLQLNADAEVLVVAPEKVAPIIVQSIGPLSSAALQTV